jgi:uncharacterized membrane protein YdjX (TVP38/TMEM64 family)
VPRRLIARGLVLLLLLAAGFAAVRWTPLREYLTRETLVALLATLRQAWWSPLALVALYVGLAPLGLPMTPLILAGGAVFGAAWGTLYNLVGTFLGATASYLLARHLGRDLVVHLARGRLDRVERLLAKHGFWALVRLRFLPLPFALANFGAALAGVSLPVFLGSALVGLAPSMLLFTYFAAALSSAAADARGAVLRNLALALAALLALTLIPNLVAAWSRRRGNGASPLSPKAPPPPPAGPGTGSRPR